LTKKDGFYISLFAKILFICKKFIIFVKKYSYE